MDSVEKAAVEEAINTVTRRSMDNGMLAAVEMIRAAAFLRPDMTMNQLADAIEATVKSNQATRPFSLQS